MDTGICFLSGFIGGVVAWEVLTFLSIIQDISTRNRAPDRAPESRAQPIITDSSEWRGVNLDTWA